jgi:hypothetical protein
LSHTSKTNMAISADWGHIIQIIVHISIGGQFNLFLIVWCAKKYSLKRNMWQKSCNHDGRNCFKLNVWQRLSTVWTIGHSGKFNLRECYVSISNSLRQISSPGKQKF